MNSSPSFFLILALLAGGLFVGRVIFPHLDPAKHQAAVQEELSKRLESAPVADSAAVLAEFARKLSQTQVEQLPEFWKSLAAAPPSTTQALQLELLRKHWEAVSPRTAEPFMQAHQHDSIWSFLNPEPSAEGEAGREGSGQASRSKLPNLTELRTAFSASDAASRPAAAAALGAALSRCDSLSAAQWANSLAEENDRAAALGGVLEVWAEAEPQQASEWIAALPEGLVKQAAVAGLVRKAASSSPKLALHFALELQDENVRAELMDRVLKFASKHCFAAAKDILGSASLSEREKQDYLESLESYASGTGTHP